MFKLKLFLVLMIVCSGYPLFAQMDFEQADSTTYRQYLDHQWKPLIKFGKKAKKAGFDNYYLNMRIGIAYYNKLQYYKAANYFKMALKNDPGSDDAKEYLFWSQLLSNDERAADDTYRTISDSTQKRIKYKIKRPLESIYVEGGVKISNNTKIANHMGYMQLGVNEKYSSVFSLYHAYTFQAQKQVWGHYMQHQYYIAPSVKFKKNMTLNIGLHYAHYKGVMDFSDAFTQHSRPPQNPGPTTVFSDTLSSHHVLKKGTYKENLLLIQASLSKTIQGFTIAPHAGIFLDFIAPNYIDGHTDTLHIDNHVGPTITSSSDVVPAPVNNLLNTKETRYEALFGLGLSYNFGRLTIGADVTAVISSRVKTAVVTPWFRALLCKRVGINAMYMYKGSYPLALFDGSQLYNSLDKIKYKASLTGEFYATKKITLYLTYQFEGIKDSFSNQDYQLHTLLIGLNFKL
ncbi:MAG: hypothetical protein JWN78_127 [Bacteroidota bacterium]|nr:hypothetical protein [Bacteroidota bacterium]